MSIDVRVDPSTGFVSGAGADDLFTLPDLADLRVVFRRPDDTYVAIERVKCRLEAM